MKAVKILITLATVSFAVALFNISASAGEKSLTVIVGDKTYFYQNTEIAYYQNKYYLKCANGVVDGIYYDTLTPPKNAEISFFPEKSSPFSITKEVYGRGINKEQLFSDIDYALNNNVKTVTATFVKLKPSVTADSLKKQTCLRGTFSTDYSLSSEGRKHNIKLACSKINGTVLNQGEEFSFNKVVGARSEETGFVNAVVIENGEYVNGIGGGVCQVSTTLYNVALISGLKTTERHQHSLLPSYVEPSFDAMVTSDYCDLKFINDTGGLTFISAFANGNTITFNIYGLRREFLYERVSVTKSSTPPEPDEIIVDELLETGKIAVIKNSKPKVESDGFLIKSKNGVVISKLKLHSDVYKAVRGVKRVGAKPPSEVA